MTEKALIETGTVRLDADLGDTKEKVLRALAGAFVDTGRANDLDGAVGALLAREDKAATGM